MGSGACCVDTDINNYTATVSMFTIISVPTATSRSTWQISGHQSSSLKHYWTPVHHVFFPGAAFGQPPILPCCHYYK